MVGDTVTWQWVDNVHQPASTTIPQGASTWSLTINSGNPTASYVITVPGVYNYQCNFHTLEGMFGKFIVEDIGTRINTVEADNQLKIYPQPFKTKLTIDLNHNSTFKNNVTVEVSNGIGQREYYINTSDILTTPLTMDLSNLAPGIYFVSIREGEIKKTYRLIKSE
jgi:hypothetical protein